MDWENSILFTWEGKGISVFTCRFINFVRRERVDYEFLPNSAYNKLQVESYRRHESFGGFSSILWDQTTNSQQYPFKSFLPLCHNSWKILRRRGEGDVFRMRSSASASFDCVDAEDLHEPSSWSTIYGLPSSSRVLHQRTLLRRPISTRYSAALHRIRRNSMPLNSVTNPSIWLSQVDIECYCGVVS